MNAIVTVQKTNKSLKKHVGTIQCSNSLSLIQRKISNALLFHAYDRLITEEEHTIQIRDLCHLIGYMSHDHKLIKQALKKLLSTVLEWNILKEEETGNEEVWTASSILASVSIDKSTCKFAYSPRMKSLMFMPSMYGRIDMAIQAQFKSTYALALYENCVRYQNLPYTGWIKLEAFRKLMGVSDDKYKIFRDFKKRIIDKAVDEVNKYSDLIVTPELRRENRNVSELRFKIDKKSPVALISKPNQKMSEKSIQHHDEVVTVLVKQFKMTSTQVEFALGQYELSYILDKINLIKTSKTFHSGKIVHLASYLLKALSEDYKPSKNISSVKFNVTAQNTNKESETESELFAQKADYQQYVTNSVSENIAQLDTSEQDKIKTDFEQYLKSLSVDFVWKFYKRDGLLNKAVKGEYHQFLRGSYPQLFESIQSWVDYCEMVTEV